VALQRIIGVQPAWMRPPYGGLNDQVVAAASARGQNCAPFLLILILLFITPHLPVALWDFDSGDAAGTPAEGTKNMYRDTANQHRSSILALNHEFIASTVCALIFDSKPWAGTYFSAPLPIDLMCSLLLSVLCKVQAIDSSL
jgi:peptidoglycan/xylan/chitin deacetylase (PgdA/CDA1 family)